jgi:predicted kinase/predicted phosphodiesterase
MRTALISDIHGSHRALLAVLSDIAGSRCDRTVCLGDVVDGGGEDAACVRELMNRGIATVLGNHDELLAHQLPPTEAHWLLTRPERLVEGEVVYIHISPRGDDRSIKDRYIAWSVLDDTAQRLAFIGHVHIPLLFRGDRHSPGAARAHSVEYGRPQVLEPGERYIICPGSVALGRDGSDLPRYAIYDEAAGTVEFRRILAPGPGALEVVIFIGLQASGKSTFYRERFAATHAHVSKDNFPNNRRPQRRQMQLLEEALTAGRSVVIDNTNPSRADREALIRAARLCGARVVGYYFSSTVAASIERNAAREGRRRVTDVGIRATAKAMERPAPDEGFDALYYVRLNPVGGFEVCPWRDDAEGTKP